MLFCVNEGSSTDSALLLFCCLLIAWIIISKGWCWYIVGMLYTRHLSLYDDVYAVLGTVVSKCTCNVATVLLLVLLFGMVYLDKYCFALHRGQNIKGTRPAVHMLLCRAAPLILCGTRVWTCFCRPLLLSADGLVNGDWFWNPTFTYLSHLVGFVIRIFLSSRLVLC